MLAGRGPPQRPRLVKAGHSVTPTAPVTEQLPQRQSWPAPATDAVEVVEEGMGHLMFCSLAWPYKPHKGGP